MRDISNEIKALDANAEELQSSLATTSVMTETFRTELDRVGKTLGETVKDVDTLERGLTKGLRRAFDDLVLDGATLSDAFETLANAMIKTTYDAAISPLTDHFGGLLANSIGGLMENILPFADGAPFSQGRVMPFASGGIVSGATPFGMRGGLGVMGEAGPEAIMPLARGADGKLGVRGTGGGGATIVMNINTPDAESFRRSQSQIAAQMSRALSRGTRNR